MIICYMVCMICATTRPGRYGSLFFRGIELDTRLALEVGLDWAWRTAFIKWY